MPQETEIAGETYQVIDAKERMTVPDCFVFKNKTGTAHGEAKFYVGNDNEETWGFSVGFPSFFLVVDPFCFQSSFIDSITESITFQSDSDLMSHENGLPGAFIVTGYVESGNWAGSSPHHTDLT